jgi:hypothetical protein
MLHNHCPEISVPNYVHAKYFVCPLIQSAWHIQPSVSIVHWTSNTHIHPTSIHQLTHEHTACFCFLHPIENLPTHSFVIAFSSIHTLMTELINQSLHSCINQSTHPVSCFSELSVIHPSVTFFVSPFLRRTIFLFINQFPFLYYSCEWCRDIYFACVLVKYFTWVF